jgi:hypothetical protein
MNARSRTILGRLLASLVALFAVVAVAARPAIAHEGEASGKASDLVRQAIAIMANEPDNVDAATDKLTDAANADDKAGVDLAVLANAKDALAAGDIAKARSLAEQAIGAQPPAVNADVTPINEAPPPTERATAPSMPAAPSMSASAPQQTPAAAGTPMVMASGAEPGPVTFDNSLSVRPELTGRDWTVLVLAIAIGLAGVYLALRFRPPRRQVTP